MIARRRAWCFSSCIVAAIATSSPALAQFPSTLTVGTRVRAEVADTVRQIPFGPRVQRIIGTVASYAPDTLHILVPNTEGTLAIPRSSVRRLHVSRGVPSQAQSIATGAVLGTLLGAAFFWLQYNTSYDSAFDAERDAALAGAGVGLVVGVVLGTRPVERWRRVRLDR